jgi:UDP-N-acetylglucosamine 4-epimerase
MKPYLRTLEELKAEPRRWLVTGVAGFIGSHLLETLLQLEQEVVGLDNFSTGSPHNLEEVRERVGEEMWKRFDCREGTVADIGLCREASNKVDYVLHQAGFVSVPLSTEDPVACHDTNVTGTLNVLIASRDNRVRRVVYASSSAVYGNDERIPNEESHLGEPLSPFAATKRMGELYASQFLRHYGLETIGLRYFNVFGPRQNPIGGYAAVVPQWIDTLIRGKRCRIHGDGSNTRDFCHVSDIVQANLLAATSRERNAPGRVFNVAHGRRTTLNELYRLIREALARLEFEVGDPEYAEPRRGDIPHSSADITAITKSLGFVPSMTVEEALQDTVRWYAGD